MFSLATKSISNVIPDEPGFCDSFVSFIEHDANINILAIMVVIIFMLLIMCVVVY
jgi:hypothetical protein